MLRSGRYTRYVRGLPPRSPESLYVFESPFMWAIGVVASQRKFPDLSAA